MHEYSCQTEGHAQVWVLTFLSLTAPLLNRTTLLTIITDVMKTGKTKNTAHLNTTENVKTSDAALLNQPLCQLDAMTTVNLPHNSSGTKL